MSQSETYVPGMNNFGGQGAANNLYSRQNVVNPNSFSANGTFVPGAVDNSPMQPMRKTKVDGEPVVGFLYSISRKGIGEFWPLHLGANTIGRASSCAIQLKEASVSDNHATLNVKQMKKTQTLIASVQDTGSKNGIYLNDEELDYGIHECVNGDVLTIGTCYKLVVLLINAKDYGLSVAEDFVPYETESEENPIPAPSSEGTDSFARNKRQFVDDGTVDLSGNRNFTSPGETKIM